MAAISIKDFRRISRLSVQQLSDSDAGFYCAAATMMAESICNRELGGVSESLTESGSDVLMTCYGHGLAESGRLYVVGSGDTNFNGICEFVTVDADTIRLIDKTLNNVTACRFCLPYVEYCDVSDDLLVLLNSPVAFVNEIRIAELFATEATEQFPDDSAIANTDFWFDASKGLFCSTITLRSNMNSYRGYRVRGMINPIRRKSNWRAKVDFFAGPLLPLPVDLVLALGALAKTIQKDPMGDKKSESYDYYSYTKMSPEEVAKFEVTAIATINRYGVL